MATAFLRGAPLRPYWLFVPYGRVTFALRIRLTSVRTSRSLAHASVSRFVSIDYRLLNASTNGLKWMDIIKNLASKRNYDVFL
jgi:hypothetical protein